MSHELATTPNMSLNIIFQKPEVITCVVRSSNSLLPNKISSAAIPRLHLLKSTLNGGQVTGFTERLLILLQKITKASLFHTISLLGIHVSIHQNLH